MFPLLWLPILRHRARTNCEFRQSAVARTQPLSTKCYWIAVWRAGFGLGVMVHFKGVDVPSDAPVLGIPSPDVAFLLVKLRVCVTCSQRISEVRSARTDSVIEGNVNEARGRREGGKGDPGKGNKNVTYNYPPPFPAVPHTDLHNP